MANPSPEMNALEERAWEAWAIAAGVAYRDRQHGLCFYDGGTKQMSWRTWQGARAAPPSPSTAPEVDERAAFEAWSKRVAPAHEIERDSFDQYVSYPVHAGWAAWQARAALASRPAEVDDEGLPPLPEGKPVMHIADETGSGSTAYTAEQYRQGQRDAVAADRARREPTGTDEKEWFVVGGRRAGRTYMAALARDAERYRWIREAQWFKAGLAKTEPQASSFHYSGDLLDKLVDAGRAAGQRQEGGK